MTSSRLSGPKSWFHLLAAAGGELMRARAYNIGEKKKETK